MKQILVLLKKDMLLEFRQLHTFYGILLYVASTIFVSYMVLGQPEASVWNALFWIIQLFICINAVAKSFMQEGKARMTYFFTICNPVNFIIAKIVYNTFLMFIMSALSILIFILILGSPSVDYLRFILIAFFGGFSLALVFTLMAAIAAKAQQNAALMAILGFPLIIPQLLLLIKISKFAFGEIFRSGAVLQLLALLISMDILVLALSLILFPFLWKE